MSDAYLVDTGVFVRWFIEQVGFKHALDIQTKFLAGNVELETVDCARYELAHVLRTKGYVKKTLTRDEYLAAAQSLDDLDLLIHSTDTAALARSAALAADRNLRFFDALFADRALERGLPLLTADKKLCNALAGIVQTELLRGVS